MKVYVVEHECPDPEFSPYLVAIFSTEEKAQAYIDKQDEDDRIQFSLTEFTVDDVEM